MFAVISAGIAPGIALLCYFYLKDDYERTTIAMVTRNFVYGSLIVFPVMVLQYAFEAEGYLLDAFSHAFIRAGLIEEFFKWFLLFFLSYKHARFNEHYDGIVFGAAISLGFATVENILYLIAYGIEGAIGRAFFPVSSHALFGVIMGYYLGKASVSSSKTFIWVFLSLTLPVVLHGLYDFMLLAANQYVKLLIVPFMFFLWWLALQKVKRANLSQRTKDLPIDKE
ncbi:glutamic-type intramembrane protease PrsW [Desertibacillus haloalkaliphilus]|uniref:glutamic-type intramembrane protease PrsW n=1 Tax=Desertibacillus haloalkaliphilus TaxID=1328930 RepID=UPI001C279DE0|nr:glutamic-type intramembrane protease PrsW [Desertibacillus haloalkaliphilus]MBU8907214.1 intramembrane metalloprotease PrsW [Desertibacillus haloalkaliphilus]